MGIREQRAIVLSHYYTLNLMKRTRDRYSRHTRRLRHLLTERSLYLFRLDLFLMYFYDNTNARGERAEGEEGHHVTGREFEMPRDIISDICVIEAGGKGGNVKKKKKKRKSPSSRTFSFTSRVYFVVHSSNALMTIPYFSSLIYMFAHAARDAGIPERRTR